MLLRLTILITLLIGSALGQALDEYQVKAAFLYNFAKFVEWPSKAFKTSTDPLVICVIGQDQMAKSLKEIVNRNAIEGRPITVRRVAPGQTPGDCHILFVGDAQSKRFRSFAKESVCALTVGETPGFATSGGIINFKLDDGRIRFEINLAAAERQQLHISSKLLSLAQLVKE